MPALVLTGGFGEFPMAPEVLTSSFPRGRMVLSTENCLRRLAGYLDAGPCVIASPKRLEPSPEKKPASRSKAGRGRVNRVSGVPVEGFWRVWLKSGSCFPTALPCPA